MSCCLTDGLGKYNLYEILYINIERKKKEIWLSLMTKAPTPTEKNSPKSNITTQKKTATKNFDYTTIADRLRMVGWVTAEIDPIQKNNLANIMLVL